MSTVKTGSCAGRMLESMQRGETMKLDASYCLTHDVYGKAAFAEVGDDQIVNYFIHNNQLIISTYNRRTTVTTEKATSLPKSLA